MNTGRGEYFDHKRDEEWDRAHPPRETPLSVAQRDAGELIREARAEADSCDQILPFVAGLYRRLADALAGAEAARKEGMFDAAKLLCWACQQGDKPQPPPYSGDWWMHPKAGISCNAGSIHEELLRLAGAEKGAAGAPSSAAGPEKGAATP